MLMVTTTMRMLDGVHGHTSNLGPRVALHSVFVESAAGLEDGLVDSSTSSDDSNHGAVSR